MEEKNEIILEEDDGNLSKHEVISEVEEKLEEEDPRHALPVEEKKLKLTKKQKIQVVSSVMILVLLIVLIVVFFLLKKSDKKVDDNTNEKTNSNVDEILTYQEIINQYGQKLDDLVDNYSKQNGKVPELESILEYAKVGDYQITCKEQNISSNRRVYLGECSVNGSEETYSYGVKDEIIVSNTPLTIYMGDRGYGTEYFFGLPDEESNFKQIATIPCDFDSCKGYAAFEQYAAIKSSTNDEVWNYHLYDYQNNKYLVSDSDIMYVLSYQKKFYGIYYHKNDKNYFYSVSAGKSFNVDGEYVEDLGWGHCMLPAGYLPLLNLNTEKIDFVNLNTGKVVYSIDNVFDFVVDTKTNQVYILQQIEHKIAENYKYTYKVYDSKGFVLFDGEEFDQILINNGTIVTVKNNTFSIYNSKYQKVYTSKTYTYIMTLFIDYVLVVDGTNLNLVDYKGNIVTTFINDWSDEKYYYHSMLSGWYTQNGKNGIYLVIAGGDVSKEEILKNNPEMTEEELESTDLGNEYYYIPATKESGKIATYIGGYAKPVLYLYPILPTWINVTFKYPENLTTTYPKYKNNWTVLANPNGDLYDLSNKYYYGLYWEEKENHRINFDEGFYVTKDNAIEFLEEKLSIIGLNDRERNEFIMYWLPILEKNGKSLVYFELTEERDLYSPIHISPKPNSMLRVAIHVKKVNKEIKIKEQVLPTFERKGFTVVEWGGITY